MSSPVNVEVVARDNESFDRLLKRFLKKIKKIKLMEEVKSHERYYKPSEIRREKEKQRLKNIKKIQAEKDPKQS